MPKKKQMTKDEKEETPSQLTLGDFLFPGTGLTEAASVLEQHMKEENVVEKICFVCRTKKGGIPVKVESRSSGKKVTIIENVFGDYKILLQEFKTIFGTGGLFRDGSIELQGDLKVKVSKYLNDNKHLLKPYGSVK